LLNAVSGVVREIAQPRSSRPESSTIGPSPATARRLHRRAIGVARFLADALTATPRARQRAVAVVERRVRDAQIPDRAALRRRLYRRRFMLRLTTDRALPIAIALIVVIAAGASLAPGAAPVGAAEGAPVFAIGGDARVRLSIGGNVPADLDSAGTARFAEAAVPVDDGTLYKPVAVDTTIKSSAGMLDRYKVRDGDTLTGIASRFGVSMMTVWWANKLETKDSLKVGQTLVIPPVNGLIVTVETGDTLQSLAREHKITEEEIVEVNELDDPNLIVGQVLVLPGARGEPLPTPKPTPAPVVPVGGGGCGTCGGTIKYQGGPWAWPVVGGGNYISQYFTSGHLGLDIAADYGSTVVSPLAGHVVFAGWKSNGGGYQVWVSHGNGIYTSLNHMSAVTASTGQNVGRGDRVGRVGMSGWASGPHLHVEVWIGAPWQSGSYRVNPLRYY
jgi:murein DD-endopeptidase MepM/ murein hydrolase activator NlpD